MRYKQQTKTKEQGGISRPLDAVVMVQQWMDRYGDLINAGDILRNPYNEPMDVPVLKDENGLLYLGDYETPFNAKYCFDEYWEIVA